MTVSIGGDAATLTFAGLANPHTTAGNISNLTISFLDAAFNTTTLASNVTDSSNALGTISFIDAGTGAISYGSTTFTENAANNGTIPVTNYLTLTLAGDTWKNTISIGNGVTVTNLPANLVAAVTRIDGATLTIGISGNALSHANSNDIGNLTVIFNDAAFDTLQAVNVTNAVKNDLVIDFNDVTTAVLNYSTSTFTENVNNNGTVSGSAVVTLAGGGTFAPTLTAGTDIVFSNVPSGLTGVITRNSTTQATITLTGTAIASANANDIANFTVTWADSAFSGVLSADVVGNVKNDFVIDYSDVSLAYTNVVFSESAVNNGSVVGALTVTLTGDTFVTPLSTLHAFVSNVPAGLTAVVTRTSPTTAIITLTGTAQSHLTADDITNLTITWQDG